MKHQHFQQYRQKARTINSANELLPGLNDISDAFEALPLDLIKYFTLLKEIDAKCINTVPAINQNIQTYIRRLHGSEGGGDGDKDEQEMSKTTKIHRLTSIRNKIHEVIPCLEEKMHVASVATDLLHKHLFRIDNDYKLITHNNEVPESIRIGPLNHPAMIMDSSSSADSNKMSAQSQRSESRREALAAKKANKETADDEDGTKRKKPLLLLLKEPTPSSDGTGAKLAHNSKKRARKDPEEISRPETPSGAGSSASSSLQKKKTLSRPKKDDKESFVDVASGPAGGQQNSTTNEPTYCYCNQVSFGEMVGCDGDDCKREWFHLPCIGFKNPPKGKWYCDDCLAKLKKVKKV